jgi:K+-sensing histidine kinase KdpD
LEWLLDAAHDIRSPLTVISGTASTLQTQHPAAHDGLEKIVHEAHRIGWLLEGYVARARLDSGVPLRREWTTAEELISGALARVDALLAGRRVTTTVEANAVLQVDVRYAELAIGDLVETLGRDAPAGMSISLAARREPTAMVIELRRRRSDRGDPSRAIPAFATCDAIVRAHGGRLVSQVTEGELVICVELPDLVAPAVPLPSGDS